MITFGQYFAWILGGAIGTIHFSRHICLLRTGDTHAGQRSAHMANGSFRRVSDLGSV